ncbi:MAG: phospholipase D family protein [Calditrichaeota bacterium]|nr:MAG: phospholipase D family protein [Calditrichota bacterium]MBL1207800.1 phospholipase D family protein [Calditrichota bacterium]NOG47634.1 phospholipase D family protein [Calditrichota bacterium]
MKKILLIISLILFIGCSSNKRVFKEHDQEFCSSIHRDSTITLDEQLAPVVELMKNKTGVYSLEEGDMAMVARAWLSEYAEETIDIQYFIFSMDNVGLIAVDYILRAADRGVKVRLLLDDLLVDATAEDIVEIDSHENISVKIYNPSANIGKNIISKVVNVATNFRGVNQRMHNKTFTVDGKIVITGGRNIADEYFDYDHEYNFRDRDILLIGGVANQVQKSFDEYWNDPLSTPILDLVEVSEMELNAERTFEWLHQYACNPENFWPQVREKITNIPHGFKAIQESGDLQWLDSVYYVSDAPGKNDERIGLKGGGISTDALVDLIENAKSSVTIQSPYLVTTKLGQGLFRKAVKRGVKVRILTNSLSSTDNLEAFNGYQRNRQDLLKSGVRIYEFKPDAAVRYEVMTSALQKKLDFQPIFGLHSKSMVVDGRISVIGTFNLDPRSANLNTECVVIVHSKEFGEKLENVMNVEFMPENSWETTLAFNPDSEAGWWKQFKAWTRRIIPKSIL